jgi:hypothetical protein
MYSPAPNEMGLCVNSNEVIRIDSAGNVGIGTMSPFTKLHITSAAGNGDGTVFVENTLADWGMGLKVRGGGNVDNERFALNVQSAAGDNILFAQSKTGNVGIGTTNPSGNVHLFRDVGTTHTGFGARIDAESRLNSSSATDRKASIGTYRANNWTPYTGMLLQSRQNGTINYLYHDDSGQLRTTTDVWNVGTTSGTLIGTQTSDERLKNIEDGFEYGLSHVLQLQPIAYTQENDAVRKLGFGAQTTQKIVPESVFDTGDCIDGYDIDSEDGVYQIPRSDDTRLGMEYVQLIPVLTKAIQEQQTMIDELKTQNQALITRIETLENK